MAEEEQQLRRPQPGQEPITYGDVFQMTGDLADKPISPRDAAAMQSAENRAFGKMLKDGPAALMNSAAAKNVQAGHVGLDYSSGAVPGEQRVAEPHVHVPMKSPSPSATESEEGKEERRANVTIGEALEAAAVAIGDKPVDRKDAAAIAAAEMRATGANAVPADDSLGAAALAAVTVNERMMQDEDKTTVAEVIGDAKSKLSDDKPAGPQDAEWVTAAEVREDAEGVITGSLHGDLNRTTTTGGVAESVAAAARINEP